MERWLENPTKLKNKRIQIVWNVAVLYMNKHFILFLKWWDMISGRMIHFHFKLLLFDLIGIFLLNFCLSFRFKWNSFSFLCSFVHLTELNEKITRQNITNTRKRAQTNTHTHRIESSTEMSENKKKFSFFFFGFDSCALIVVNDVLFAFLFISIIIIYTFSGITVKKTLTSYVVHSGSNDKNNDDSRDQIYQFASTPMISIEIYACCTCVLLSISFIYRLNVRSLKNDEKNSIMKNLQIP